MWTTPALQEEFDVQLAVGCKSCVRPVCAACRERASSTTSFASVWLDHGDFRSTPANGHRQNNGISQERQSGSASLGNRSLGRTADSHSGEQRSRLDSGSPEETPLPIFPAPNICGDFSVRLHYWRHCHGIERRYFLRRGLKYFALQCSANRCLELTIEYLRPVEFERKVGLA